MSPREFLHKDRRITLTAGVLLVLITSIVSGTGATVTFKMAQDEKIRQAETRLEQNENAQQDHEDRLRMLEAQIPPALSRIEANIQAIKERLK
jgi:hypothetical protein